MRDLMQRIFMMLNYLKSREDGQGLTEYALILVLVAIVCVAALLFLGGSLNNVLSNVGNVVSSPPVTSS